MNPFHFLFLLTYGQSFLLYNETKLSMRVGYMGKCPSIGADGVKLRANRFYTVLIYCQLLTVVTHYIPSQSDCDYQSVFLSIFLSVCFINYNITYLYCL